MGKRSTFERAPRDFYPTPLEAVKPLLRFLEPGGTFVEPCAGDGALVRALTDHGMICKAAFDIEPQAIGINRQDAMTWNYTGSDLDYIITNPPWRRDVLHPMIERFRNIAPTWLLFDADWMHTKQAAPFMDYVFTIVSVGRVKWIPGSKMTGKDNCAWYLFTDTFSFPRFVGRQ